jgi:hypothetical protein
MVTPLFWEFFILSKTMGEKLILRRESHRIKAAKKNGTEQEVYIHDPGSQA